MPFRIASFVLLAALTAGCQVLHVEVPGDAVSVEHLLSGEAVFGAPVPGDVADAALIEPDAGMREFVAGRVLAGKTSVARLARLLGKLVEEDYFAQGYRPSLTQNAADTFAAKAGNCLSYTNMFVALARLAGLDARFQIVDVPPRFDADLGLLLRNTHINVLVTNGEVRGMNRGDVTVDFNAIDTTDYPKQVVSDAHALALYYNNLSVERWRDGHRREAFAYLRRALETDARNANLWVNLGAFYSKHGFYRHAISAHGQALKIERFNRPAMGGLAVAYEGLGQHALSTRYAQRVQSYRKRNPYYHFALAQVAFDQLSYGESVAFVERALELKRDDHRFHRLKGRAHEMLGEPEAAQASHALAERYERRKGIAPTARVGERLL